MQKSILALDLGTSCGWAYRYYNAIISGAWDLKPNRYSGGGMRFIKFIAFLDELHDAKPIGMVFFEEVRAHKGVDAAHVYGGLMATLQAWCEQKGIPYEGVPVGEIKRFATGKGNASKEAVQSAVEDWGYFPKTFDEADALALLCCRSGRAEADEAAAAKLDPAGFSSVVTLPVSQTVTRERGSSPSCGGDILGAPKKAA